MGVFSAGGNDYCSNGPSVVQRACCSSWCSRSEFGSPPSPLWGGVGGGGGAIPSQVAPSLSHRITPLPSPPRQGGREQTECAARLGAHKALPFDNGDATRYRPAKPGAEH